MIPTSFVRYVPTPQAPDELAGMRLQQWWSDIDFDGRPMYKPGEGCGNSGEWRDVEVVDGL